MPKLGRELKELVRDMIVEFFLGCQKALWNAALYNLLKNLSSLVKNINCISQTF